MQTPMNARNMNFSTFPLARWWQGRYWEWRWRWQKGTKWSARPPPINAPPLRMGCWEAALSILLTSHFSTIAQVAGFYWSKPVEYTVLPELHPFVLEEQDSVQCREGREKGPPQVGNSHGLTRRPYTTRGRGYHTCTAQYTSCLSASQSPKGLNVDTRWQESCNVATP